MKSSLVYGTVTVPRHNRSSQTIYGNFAGIDGPPDQVWQTMTATDGQALPQVVPLVSFNAIHTINDS